MFKDLPPITKNIIIINIVVYVVSNFWFSVLNNPLLYNSLSAFYPFSPFFRSWQLITHMFMHAPFGNGTGIMHILFNMMTLWSFSFLERLLGGKRFLILYFLSGLGAYFLFNAWEFIQVQQITSQLESYGFNVSNFLAEGKGTMRGTKISIDQQNILVEKLKDIVASPMLGASGAIFGVVAAFATIFPDEKLIIMFIPYPIKAKYLLIGTMVISVFLGVMGNVGGIAHFAHVGGALVGFLLAKMWKNHLNRFNQQ